MLCMLQFVFSFNDDSYCCYNWVLLRTFVPGPCHGLCWVPNPEFQSLKGFPGWCQNLGCAADHYTGENEMPS